FAFAGQCLADPAKPPIRIVSTPNPSVLPLLLAMANHPDLPVQLEPVGQGSEIGKAFSRGGAEGLVSMTWVAALQAIRGVAPDLRLVSVDYWRGFFTLAPSSAHLSRLADLGGRNLLISGPVGGGRDGGPDLLFQALMKRQGFDPSRHSENTVQITLGGDRISVIRRFYPSGNLIVYYLPAMEAAKVLVSGAKLDDGSGIPERSLPASALFMADPAASGIVMEGRMQGASMEKIIDVQSAFSGFSGWREGELPLGGLSLRAAVLADPSRAGDAHRIVEAYEEAAEEIMAARGRPFRMMRVASAISAGVQKYYGQYGMRLPVMVLASALRNGDLIYRTDIKVGDMIPDLERFDEEMTGSAPPASFYAGGNSGSAFIRSPST
ncbi:MAG: hypothetical protein HKL98_10110, partial [Burkholderiales bacterium]|nr:hypothetical protein [Burkholderiales bacterium]